MRRFFHTALFLCCLLAAASCGRSGSISCVEKIEVTTPEGTAPRLPSLVEVRIGGKSEIRRVKWTNSLRETEESQAALPAGSVYTVQGYIIGDNTTDGGYPVEATVTVDTIPWSVPSRTPAATALPLGDVRLTGDNRLTGNRDLDIANLLSLDITQQLYNYRDTYGLPTEGYTVSDGWDSPTTKLKGHGSGHYMSALSFAFASTSDPAVKEQLRERMARMVTELRACQERTFVWDSTLGRYREARDLAPEAELRTMEGSWAAFDRYKRHCDKYGYGYLNAIPAQHCALIEKYAPYNNELGVWAPYYSIHKQLAGLLDIAENIDDAQVSALALQTAKDMGLWVWNRLHYRTFVQEEGSAAERRAAFGNRYEMWNMYIAGEVGGMQEVLSRLSLKACDPQESAKLLEAASYFDAPAFYGPLSRNIDDIRNRHANQHIPMIVGALKLYGAGGEEKYYNIASNFWEMIQGRYSYAMGGVGNGEMFRQPYSQMMSMNTSVMSDPEGNLHPNPDINETCCAYNLAKLTKDLNCYNPLDARYMDYYERLLYNQIVGSVHPTEYGVCYQYAVGMNAIKPFGSPTPQETCCGGTGAENHVKYQEAAYFAGGDSLFVALYLPTEVNWRAKGVKFRQECKWPAERSVITIEQGGDFALLLRVPYWATDGFSAKLGGREMASGARPQSYVEIPMRSWKAGDKVEISMPFTPHLDFGPDKMDLAATGINQSGTHFDPMWEGVVMYGPLVMASPDITIWEQAQFDLSPDLREITAIGASPDGGTDGNLYSLTLGGKTFFPDYYNTGHATHYLRLNVLSGASKAGDDSGRIYLEQALQIARSRTQSSGDWAPRGYARMEERLSAAEAVAADEKATPEALTKAASDLNAAINSMRPSTLAETEDLEPLLGALSAAKQIPDKSTQLRQAIDFADMVVQYVNDGSGTKDLIEKAQKMLEAAAK